MAKGDNSTGLASQLASKIGPAMKKAGGDVQNKMPPMPMPMMPPQMGGMMPIGNGPSLGINPQMPAPVSQGGSISPMMPSPEIAAQIQGAPAVNQQDPMMPTMMNPGMAKKPGFRFNV